jgi:hypothetical protein
MVEILRVIAATVENKVTRLHFDQKAMLQVTNGIRKQKRELKLATVTNLFGPEKRTAPKKEKESIQH